MHISHQLPTIQLHSRQIICQIHLAMMACLAQIVGTPAVLPEVRRGKPNGLGRPTKSCERCRSKKLRCDREFPCGSCKKGGKSGSDCSYRDGWEPWDREEDMPAAKKAKASNSGAGMNGGGRMSVLEKMVRIGEAMGGPGHGPQSPSTGSTRLPDGRSQSALGATSYASSSTLGRINIKGQRTRYVAPGDKMKVMDHVGAPHTFFSRCQLTLKTV